MRLEIEVWLRRHDTATTDSVDVPIAEPAGWTEADVRVVLSELLRAIDRRSHPDAPRERPVMLRGFSWIVSPFESGGYTIAVEIQLGASATGPFDVDQKQVERLITSVMAQDRAASDGAPSIH